MITHTHTFYENRCRDLSCNKVVCLRNRCIYRKEMIRLLSLYVNMITHTHTHTFYENRCGDLSCNKVVCLRNKCIYGKEMVTSLSLYVNMIILPSLVR